MMVGFGLPECRIDPSVQQFNLYVKGMICIVCTHTLFHKLRKCISVMLQHEVTALSPEQLWGVSDGGGPQDPCRGMLLDVLVACRVVRMVLHSFGWRSTAGREHEAAAHRALRHQGRPCPPPQAWRILVQQVHPALLFLLCAGVILCFNLTSCCLVRHCQRAGLIPRHARQICS